MSRGPKEQHLSPEGEDSVPEGLVFSHTSLPPPDPALPLPICQGTRSLGEVSDLHELTQAQVAELSPDPTWAQL